MFGSFEFKSKCIDTNVKVTLYVPDFLLEEKKDDIKVLYLLHGYSGNNDSWFLLTQAIAYADKFKVAIVSPMGFNSFYTNGAFSKKLNYFTYIEDEVVTFVQNTFGLMKKRENNFVAGLSMGGFGAIKVGILSKNFNGIGTFSGALFKQEDFLENTEGRYNAFKDIFTQDGEVLEENCLYKITEKNKDRIKTLFLTCGKNDEIPFLYEGNLAYVSLLKELEIPFETYFDDLGHDYFHWNIALLKYLEFLKNKDLI
ncbi:MAG: alpha/beta hydrolase [Lachnospirales bacterium]